MKIAVTGKGGVGKTTISAVLARLYAEEGKKVFAVDVDPDANLGLALGFSEEELESITPISKMRRLIEERTGADKSNTFYKVNPKVDDIPEIYGKEKTKYLLLEQTHYTSESPVRYFFYEKIVKWCDGIHEGIIPSKASAVSGNVEAGHSA